MTVLVNDGSSLLPGAATQAAASVQTRRAWDTAAAGWHAHAPLIRAWLASATQLMLDAANIQPGARVLDVAAGAGDQTLDVLQRVGASGHVLATDISPAILALAHCNARAAGHTNVTLRVADAQAQGLPCEAFDAAVCRLGLMFCHEPLRALTAIHTALKPGGRTSGLVFAAPSLNPCLLAPMAIAQKYGGNPWAAMGSPCEPGTLMSLGQPGLLESLLARAGFIDVDVRSVSAPFAAPSVGHYVLFLQQSASPIMELLARLSPALQQAAWQEMAQALDIYSTPVGWVGPKTLLLYAATASHP